MEEAKKSAALEEVRSTLLEMVADGIEAEIPQVMVEKKIDSNVEDFAYRLQTQGLDLKTYLQYTARTLKNR